MTVIEIITRHLHTRKQQLARLQKSLAGQISTDFIHTVLVDEVGAGVPAANLMLRDVATDLKGDYIWVVDDDDIIINDAIVSDLNKIGSKLKPAMIMVKCAYPSFDGEMPPAHLWKRAPQFGQICMNNFIVRRDIYQQHAEAFAQESGADYSFLVSVFGTETDIYWYPVRAVKVFAPSFGAPNW